MITLLLLSIFYYWPIRCGQTEVYISRYNSSDCGEDSWVYGERIGPASDSCWIDSSKETYDSFPCDQMTGYYYNNYYSDSECKDLTESTKYDIYPTCTKSGTETLNLKGTCDFKAPAEGHVHVSFGVSSEEGTLDCNSNVMENFIRTERCVSLSNSFFSTPGNQINLVFSCFRGLATISYYEDANCMKFLSSISLVNQQCTGWPNQMISIKLLEGCV